jgi:group I intron endonuclease
MKGIVYSVENKINNKLYVGQTIRKHPRRKNQHINDPEKSSAIDRSIQKYGKDNFEWKILEEDIDNQRDLNLLEKFWIVHLETRTTQWGYNIKEGGSNGKHSEKTKQTMSNQRFGKNNPNYGKHLSEETKNKISKTKTGKKLSNEHKEKISKGLIGNRHYNETKLKISEKNHGKYHGVIFLKDRNPELKCWECRVSQKSFGVFIDPISPMIISKFIRDEIYKEDS